MVGLAALALGGCARALPLPVAYSPAPVPRLQVLYAAFGRAEITPPALAGMFGYGPQARAPRGFGQRLHARALVLEDPRGERIALVTADLGAVSTLLQRRVAALTMAYGIGADRLFLSATHTHAAPGNFYGGVYDVAGTSIDAAGYDAELVDFLAGRIASAVAAAAAGLRPARVAWGISPVWGFTRNRSVAAYYANVPLWTSRFEAPDTLDGEARAVDPAWTMLRVDLANDDGEYRPAGAYSVFGIHGTALPQTNELYDADVHGILARRLEQHIDSLTGHERGARTRATHLVANGTVADVAPGVMGSRAAMGWLGDSIAAYASALFDSLQPTEEPFLVERAAGTFRLFGRDRDLPGLCAQPRAGADMLGRAPVRWSAAARTLVFGARAIAEPIDACHGPKTGFLEWLQAELVRSRAIPRRVDVAVLRMGPMTVVTLPTEISTTAGARLREQIGREVRGGGAAGDSVVVVSLTNGYLQYTVTREEYALQLYEGASTLYGPGQAYAFQQAALRLANARSGAWLEADTAGIIRLGPLLPRTRTFPADEGPATVARRAEAMCAPGRLQVRWHDVLPGRMMRDTTVWLSVREDSAGQPLVAWDDMVDAEIRLDGSSSGRARWRYVWYGATAGTRYNITIRPQHPDAVELTVDCRR